LISISFVNFFEAIVAEFTATLGTTPLRRCAALAMRAPTSDQIYYNSCHTMASFG